MYSRGVPTDQRAGVRPISFVLDAGGSLSDPVNLKIRPEELTRTEPSRATIHQTMGRDFGPSGWVDNFGEGLPSLTLSGHTGWRPSGADAEDGVKAFERLNNLVLHAYHAAKQGAIDTGRDPAEVKLLFIDMLDSFAWSVVPTQFVLRRSRSRPLLMQYNIALQAVSTSIDTPSMLTPSLGSISAGLGALGGVLNTLIGYAGKVEGWVNAAISTVAGFVAPLAANVRKFMLLSTAVFGAVKTAVASVNNGVKTITGSIVGVARDLAIVGVNVFRTISALASVPATIKAALGQVSAAFNEVLCVFSNSLRPRKTYQNYDGLYGASNCSSTTGGRGASVYLNENVFGLMQADQPFVVQNTPAMASTAALARTDPVLAPMALAEVDRHVVSIISGTTVAQP